MAAVRADSSPRTLPSHLTLCIKHADVVQKMLNYPFKLDCVWLGSIICTLSSFLGVQIFVSGGFRLFHSPQIDSALHNCTSRHRLTITISSHHTPTHRRHVFSAYQFSSLGIFNGFVTFLPSLMQQPSECVCVSSPCCFLHAWIIHPSPLIVLFSIFVLKHSLTLLLSHLCHTHPVSLLSESLSSLSVSTLFLFIPSLRPDVVIPLKQRKTRLRAATADREHRLSSSLSRRAEGQNVSAVGRVYPATATRSYPIIARNRVTCGSFKLLFMC